MTFAAVLDAIWIGRCMSILLSLRRSIGLKQIKLRALLLGENFFGLGWERQIEAESLSKALTGFGGEPFEVIAGKRPDTADFGEMSVDLERRTCSSILGQTRFVKSLNRYIGE